MAVRRPPRFPQRRGDLTLQRASEGSPLAGWGFATGLKFSTRWGLRRRHFFVREQSRHRTMRRVLSRYRSLGRGSRVVSVCLRVVPCSSTSSEARRKQPASAARGSPSRGFQLSLAPSRDSSRWPHSSSCTPAARSSPLATAAVCPSLAIDAMHRGIIVDYAIAAACDAPRRAVAWQRKVMAARPRHLRD